MRQLLFALAAALGLSTAAFGNTVVFSDNFNSENGGVPTLNYFGFANWTVPSGSVDLIGNGFFDLQPGNGLYVDMDGSTNQAGTLLSKSISLGAGAYIFSYDLAGSQRGPTTSVLASVVGVPTATQLTTSASSDPFAVLSIDFVLPAPQNINLEFQSLDGPSNIGSLIDNVILSAVTTTASAPVPASVWTSSGLMVTLAALKIRRKFMV